MSTPRDTAPGPDEAQWRRQPVRAILARILSLLLAAAALTFGLARDTVEDWLTGEPIDVSFTTVALILFVVGTALGMIGAALEWSRFRYAVDENGLHTRSGVLSTTTASYAAARIDGIDIEEPVLQRIAGLATLKVEVAGGSESAAELGYLPRAEADRLQAELFALRDRARRAPAAAAAPMPPGTPEGVEPADEVAAAADQEADDGASQPRETLLAIGPDRARQYLLASPAVWGMAVLAVLGLAGAIVSLSADGLGGSIRWLLLAVGWCVGAARLAFGRWREVSTWTIEAGPHDLVVSRGRLNRKRTTIRAERVSAVVLNQGPIRRRLGWWQVQVAVSALGASSDDSRTTVCAVATSDEVAMLLPRLMPDLPPLTGEELASAQQSATPAPHWVAAQRFGRWWSPLGWRFNAILMQADHALTRTGRWQRELRLIDRRRIQTVQVLAGPLDRRAGVAALVVGLPPGPAATTALPFLPAEQASDLMDELAIDAAREPARSTEPQG